MQVTGKTSDMVCWSGTATGPPLLPTSQSLLTLTLPYFSLLTVSMLYTLLSALLFCSLWLLPFLTCDTRHADLSVAPLGSGGIFAGMGTQAGFPPWGSSFAVHGTWCMYWTPLYIRIFTCCPQTRAETEVYDTCHWQVDIQPQESCAIGYTVVWWHTDQPRAQSGDRCISLCLVRRCLWLVTISHMLW